VVAECALPEAASTGWNVQLLKALCNRVEKAGLTLVGLDRLPCRLDKVLRGEAGRDEEIEAACEFVRAAGAVGVALIGYTWTAQPDGETRKGPQGRGGALVRHYKVARGQLPAAEPTIGAAVHAWNNLGYFLERLMPVAEKAGVKMACRPDSPLAVHAGAPGILSTVEGLKRLVESVSSPSNGLDLQLGSLAMMPGADVAKAIAWFGSRGRILLATLQNPVGEPPTLSDAFLDEGTTNMLGALRCYQEVGFEGMLRPAEQPGMVGDTMWGHKAQAFAMGYLRALLQVVERLGPAGPGAG
jgi:mannonate dehydratase